MEALWPDRPPVAATNNPRVVLHAARRALAPATIHAQADRLSLGDGARLLPT